MRPVVVGSALLAAALAFALPAPAEESAKGQWINISRMTKPAFKFVR